ncbi:hypothetical protein CROQUDRAFT_404423 [Cronartium quercuum f. sp. fusiforme G11]|uniref:Uncharacterized protein n=1 Tax=Cronartium quercuum f. sp. fusiforme G11 TaxID=708437 RepID=A0A9P6THC1_9BASI|nr:hypothetical protein CROQUDRAFT_404423 [Cronartium quercuum f. sp. fusiforme G11]
MIQSCRKPFLSFSTSFSFYLSPVSAIYIYIPIERIVHATSVQGALKDRVECVWSRPRLQRFGITIQEGRVT